VARDMVRFDENEDGVISFKEFKAGVLNLGPDAHDWLTERLEIVETRKHRKSKSNLSQNHARAVSQPAQSLGLELDAALEGMEDGAFGKENGGRRTKHRSKSLDRSVSPLESTDDFHKLLNKAFKKADKNGDGVISESELKRLVKKVCHGCHLW